MNWLNVNDTAVCHSWTLMTHEAIKWWENFTGLHQLGQ